MAIDAIVGALTAIGVGGETAAAVAPVLAGAGEGAALGAGTSALTGQNPLTGAELGGLTGGAIGGLGPTIGSVTGLGETAGDILAGAGAGALGGELTGTSPLTGALSGGGAGLVAGLTSGASTAPSGASGSAPSAGGGSGIATANLNLGGASGFPTGDIGSGLGSTGGLGLDAGGSPLASGTTPNIAGAATGGVNAAPVANVLGGVDAGGAADITGGGGTGGNLMGFGGNAPTPVVTPPTGTGGILSMLGLGGSTPSSDSMFSLQSVGGAPGATVGTGTGAIPTVGGGATVAGPSSVSQLGTALGSGNVGDIASAAGNVITSNPGAILSGLGLGYQALTAGNQTGALKTLEDQAASENATGQQLQSYITSGTLPPGAQSAITMAIQAANARTKQTFANLGMSGSTEEATELNQNAENAAAQVNAIATQLLQQGIQISGLSADTFAQIMQQQNQSTQALGSAIANFAAAAGGSTGGNTIKIVSGNA